MSNEPNDARSPCDLLPCPYCGRAARYVAEDYVDNSGEPWPFAECDACNTGAPVEFWNKRAQPADQQGEPIALSGDVREYLQEGIENATGCEDSDVDYDFAEELAMLLGPLYRHAQPATAKADEHQDIDAAARKLAECMDYPWEYMPEQGRASMREHAKAVIEAGRTKLNSPQ